MEQLVPDRIDSILTGNNPVPNQMNDLVADKAGIGTVACSQASISRRIDDIQGWGMAQILERLARYLRKHSD